METVVGAFLAAVVGLFATWIASRLARQTEKDLSRTAQLELRRTQRHEFLIGLMNDLMQARTEYEEWLGSNPHDPVRGQPYTATEFKEHAKIVGKAITVCLASGDATLTELAIGNEGMTPYVGVQNGRDRNRNSMVYATSRLAELLSALTEHEEEKPTIIDRIVGLFKSKRVEK